MKIRVIFTVYNRAEYFRRTVNSWNLVRGVFACEPVAFIDPSPQLEAMRRIFALIGSSRVNPKRFGVQRNNWQAINEIFDNTDADAIVLAEDDVLVSDDVLEYFSWAFKTYAGDPDVMAATAFCGFETYDGLEDVASQPEDGVLRHNRMYPWVWGTWRDRWNGYFRSQWDDEEYTYYGWDCNVNRLAKRDRLLTVGPMLSRSDHIGEYGEHMDPLQMDHSRGIGYVRHRPEGLAYHEVTGLTVGDYASNAVIKPEEQRLYRPLWSQQWKSQIE